MALPRAEVVPGSAWRYLGRWLAVRLAPPQTLTRYSGFPTASFWSITGALAAGIGLGLYLLLHTGAFWRADLAIALSWAVFAGMGVVFLFWPFLLSYYTYLPLARALRSRPVAAVYGALWHMGAHAAVIYAMQGDQLDPVLVVPLVVGGLWGSWLPAAVAADERRL